ncbi:MAG: NTPase [Euryarchaeota archaeon]|nr:NTPase [Euryarchaeota archaeon]
MKILITGKPGSGKTTLLARVAQELGKKAGGMVTREIRERGRRVGFYVENLSTGEKATFAHVALPKARRVGKYGVDMAALERVGVKAIEQALRECELVLIDEIAPMELYSNAFIRAVEEAFSSPKQVVASIHLKSKHPLITSLKSRRGVVIYTINEENREEVFRRVMEVLEHEGEDSRVQAEQAGG